MSCIGDTLRTMSSMHDTQRPMLHLLASVCREHRRARQHTQAHVAERVGISRSAVNEFEATRNWPRDPDRLVRGYADSERDAAQMWLDAAQQLLDSAQGATT